MQIEEFYLKLGSNANSELCSASAFRKLEMKYKANLDGEEDREGQKEKPNSK
jgi:hypothetical protein